jgi:hypothetical protein
MCKREGVNRGHCHIEMRQGKGRPYRWIENKAQINHEESYVRRRRNLRRQDGRLQVILSPKVWRRYPTVHWPAQHQDRDRHQITEGELIRKVRERERVTAEGCTRKGCNRPGRAQDHPCRPTWRGALGAHWDLKHPAWWCNGGKG